MALNRSRYHTDRRVEVPICTNLELLDEHRHLDAMLGDELKELRQASKDSVIGHDRPPSADKLAEVEARMGREKDIYVIEKVGKQAWVALQMEHPPKNAEQRQRGFDTDTFPPAALHASCTEVRPWNGDPPETLDPADASWLFANLPDAQWDALWEAVLDVNMGHADGPKSVTLALLDQLLSNGSSPTASTTA